jgi:hypothetical protein
MIAITIVMPDAQKQEKAHAQTKTTTRKNSPAPGRKEKRNIKHRSMIVCLFLFSFIVKVSFH